jgi:hypothetical protein
MRKSRKLILHLAVVLSLLVGWSAWISAQDSNDPLAAAFLNPPDSAKPRVWWHWMNGNITKEGIKLDLEWMKRVGIGGFQNFDAALNTPKLVDTRLVYMTPEWKEAFLYATTLADQLGLEEAIAGSPGWSESGAPWVKPNQAMKKLVWSETHVQGGQPFRNQLAKPPSVILASGFEGPCASTSWNACIPSRMQSEMGVSRNESCRSSPTNGTQLCCDDGKIHRRNSTRTGAGGVFQHGIGKHGKWSVRTSSRLVVYNQQAREQSGRRTMVV